MKPLKKAVQKRAFSVSTEVAKIIPVSLGKDCTVIGAATLVFKEIFKSKAYYYVSATKLRDKEK